MYRKPVIMRTDDLAEGVYAASGASGCYTAEAHIHQSPETGRDSYVIQVNGYHNADHTSKQQLLTISFNMPVKFKSCSEARSVKGSGTPTLFIELDYSMNRSGDIGFGDLVVQAESEPTINNVTITEL